MTLTGCLFTFGSAHSALNEENIQINNGLISVSLNQAPLAEVLQIIANQTKIHIDLGASTDRPVTKKFSNIPFEEGLKRLLRPYNHVIVYRNTASSSPIERIEKIVILDKSKDGGQAVGIANSNKVGTQIPPSAPPSGQTEPEPEKTLEFYAQQLKTEDLAVRMQSAIEMGRKYQIKALDYLEEVLINDTSPEVRMAVAKTIGNMKDEETIPALAKGLLDPDDGVRTAALTALGYIRTPAVLPVLRTALDDTNQDIRDKAASQIDQIEKAQ